MTELKPHFLKFRLCVSINEEVHNSDNGRVYNKTNIKILLLVCLKKFGYLNMKNVISVPAVSSRRGAEKRRRGLF